MGFCYWFNVSFIVLNTVRLKYSFMEMIALKIFISVYFSDIF